MDSAFPVDAFAVAAPGLETIVAGELNALRATRPRAVEGGVEFRASRELLYRANLHLRTASRVLVRLASFHASSFAELERRARRVPWERIVPDGAQVRLRVTCRKSRLYHSDGVAERLVAAIGGRARATPLENAPPDLPLPDDDPQSGQLFVVRVERDECTISADSSGAHLHKRGYRQAVTQAPVRETLAAAIVLASGWDRQAPLLDPFCGSGTIPIEAALLARRIAPGHARRFRFMDWPDFHDATWRRVHDVALEDELPASPAVVVGSDRSGWAMRAAAGNAARAGVARDIQFERADVSQLAPPPGSAGWIVTNPPYGVRLGKRDELRRLYADFGGVLRERFPRWHVGILSTDRRLDGQLRVALLDRFRTTNGGLGVHFLSGLVSARHAPVRVEATDD